SALLVPGGFAMNDRETERLMLALRRRGYEEETAEFPTRRPGRAILPLRSSAGEAVVAKLYASGDGEAAYAGMRELWRSSFGARRRPAGLPRPIAYLPEAGALLMERLEG